MTHEIDPTLKKQDNLRERTMSLAVASTVKSGIETTDVIAHLANNAVLPDCREGRLLQAILQHGIEDSAAKIILGIGDSLVALNMIRGPITPTKEVFEP